MIFDGSQVASDEGAGARESTTKSLEHCHTFMADDLGDVLLAVGLLGD